jgi:uncharacterized RDD family membrane protein YckC
MPRDETAAINRRTTDALVQRRMTAQAIDIAIGLFTGVISLAVYPPACALLVAAFLAKDAIPYVSVGKTCLGLTVVDIRTKGRCSLSGSLLRNALLVPPVGMVEALILSFSREGIRLGDVLAGTYVAYVAQPLETLDIPARTSGTTVTVTADLSARRLLCVDAAAGDDAVEDAFWQFADRYSDDATRGLGDEELAERCQELARRCETEDTCGLNLPGPLSQPATREQMHAYITAHVIAVNRARDLLIH